MKVVIVGGVAGGASAAARLRRLDEQAEIVMIERSAYVSYANCGLPYFIGDVITDRAKLTLQTPESFRTRFNVDARVNQEVTAIDRAAKQVTVLNRADGTSYVESYDKLILSPGAKPVIPNIPIDDSDKLFTLRTVEDTLAIHGYVQTHQPKTAAVIGGGFIGVEVAENLAERGVAVTLYQRPTHVLPILDDDMASFVHAEMTAKGIELRLGANVKAISDTGGSIAVADQDDEQAFDMAVLAIGVAPESSLAIQAGLEAGIKGAIVVDGHMRTSDPDIYAVGDAVQVKHFVTGADAHIALAGPANKQGRIAADNICGIPSVFDGSMGSSVLKVFDLTVAATGLSAKGASAAGLDFDYVLLSPPSHATYYPGSNVIRMKVLFECGTGRILGAQAVGKDGVEKRIDVIATAIHARMTGHDLAELDLAYAPPFSSAKDPVNMAGFMISNIVDGLVEQVQWDRALALTDDEMLLDVRTPAERGRGCIAGTLHIPVDELRERMGELPREKRIFVHCQSGVRSYIACRVLSQNGFSCANVAGGWAFYASIYQNKLQDGIGKGSCGL